MLNNFFIYGYFSAQELELTPTDPLLAVTNDKHDKVRNCETADTQKWSGVVA